MNVTLGNKSKCQTWDTYAVEYIYIGEIERKKYSPNGLQKFSRYHQFYELIYESEGVSIYEVK